MKEILSHFAIPNEVADPQPLKIGFINDSYIVRTDKGLYTLDGRKAE